MFHLSTHLQSFSLAAAQHPTPPHSKDIRSEDIRSYLEKASSVALSAVGQLQVSKPSAPDIKTKEAEVDTTPKAEETAETDKDK